MLSLDPLAQALLVEAVAAARGERVLFLLESGEAYAADDAILVLFLDICNLLLLHCLERECHQVARLHPLKGL